MASVLSYMPMCFTKQNNSYSENDILMHSFMQRPIHPSFGRLKTVVWMGRNMGVWVKNLRSIKNVSENLDIVSYALEVSVNGVTCVCVVHFISSDTF